MILTLVILTIIIILGRWIIREEYRAEQQKKLTENLKKFDKKHK